MLPVLISKSRLLLLTIVFLLGLVVLIVFHERYQPRSFMSSFRSGSMLWIGSSASSAGFQRNVASPNIAPSSSPTPIVPLQPTSILNKFEVPTEFYDYVTQHYDSDGRFRNIIQCKYDSKQNGPCDYCCEIYHFCVTHINALIDDIDGFCDFDKIFNEDILDKGCNCLNEASVNKTWEYLKRVEKEEYESFHKKK
jgi:hypothetical protein